MGAPPTTIRLSDGNVAASCVEVFDQPEPDGRNADAYGYTFASDQPCEIRTVGPAPRQHQLRADRGHREGQTPGVRVEHWYHRKNAVARCEAEDVGLQQPERMKKARSVGIGHALRRARRTGGEAETRGRTLIESAPGRRVPRLHHGRLERHHYRPLATALHCLRRAVDDHHLLDLCCVLHDLAGEWREVGAGDKDATIALRRHPAKLGSQEPRV